MGLSHHVLFCTTGDTACFFLNFLVFPKNFFNFVFWIKIWNFENFIRSFCLNFSACVVKYNCYM